VGGIPGELNKDLVEGIASAICQMQTILLF
jgi:hypothetical protein